MEIRTSITFITLFLLLAFKITFAQNSLNSGLHFYSHEVIQDKRTSLNLSPNQPLSVKRDVSIEFDAQFRDGDGYYGYIFKMLANDKTPIDLVSNLASETENFWLVIGNKVVAAFHWEDLGGEIYNKWVNIKVAYQAKNHTISLSINGITHESAPLEIDEINSLQIVFGASTVSKMLNTDVCPMTLKVVIISSGDKKIRHWELKKHGEEKVADLIHQDIATVAFPNWKIDEHLKWKKSAAHILPNTLGITSTPQSDSIFILGQEKMLLYTSKDQKIQEIIYQSGNPYPCLENNFVYDPKSKEILSYSFDTTVVNRFNLQNLSWEFSTDTCPEPDLWHHNKLYRTPENEIITFSGYGHYSYKSNLHKLRISEAKWDSINLSESIPPRYLSGMGRLDSANLLIFGGYGSQSGKQGINSRHLYDLYTLNLQDNSVKKIREFQTELHPFTPVSQLIILNSNNSFLTLIYNNVNFNTFLKIAEFGIEEDFQRYYQDSIPYNFLDTRSWAGLYFQANDSKLIAVTRVDSLLEFYQMAFPPLSTNEAIQAEFKSKKNPLVPLAVCLSIVLVGIGLYYWFKYNKRITTLAKSALNQPSPLAVREQKGEMQLESDKFPAIYLMGGFQIFNEKGENQTGQFTPTLKALFLLIYLATILDKKGISSDKLTELLWSDKSVTKARNNRNVNLSKMRLLLEKVSPGIQLTHDNTYWKIEHSENVFSDIRHSIALIEKLDHNGVLSTEETQSLLRYTFNGEICPSIQTDWMDLHKNTFSTIVLEAMTKLVDQVNDEVLQAEVSDTVLKFDPLNEEALKVKCITLFKMGKKSLALAAYKNFCRDYLLLLNQEYKVDFQTLLETPYK